MVVLLMDAMDFVRNQFEIERELDEAHEVDERRWPPDITKAHEGPYHLHVSKDDLEGRVDLDAAQAD